MGFFSRKQNIFEEAYFPDRYINRITDIKSNFFIKEGIKGVIIDIDNTVIDVKKNLIDGLQEWKDELKDEGIRVVVLSNSLDKPKVSKIADLLDVDYFTFGRKPNSSGFMRAKKHLDLPVENIAVIGDQIFTDILGANRVGMLSVLVNPLQEKNDYFVTKWRRPIEEKILSRYLKFIQENEDNPKKYTHVLSALEKRLENQKKESDISHTTKLSKVVEIAKQEELRKQKEKAQAEQFKNMTDSSNLESQKKKITDEVYAFKDESSEETFEQSIKTPEKIKYEGTRKHRRAGYSKEFAPEMYDLDR